jgi:hypothetical protein
MAIQHHEVAMAGQKFFHVPVFARDDQKRKRIGWD